MPRAFHLLFIMAAVIILSFGIGAAVDEEGVTTAPLGMDMHWVLQGFSFSFSGFFCEFLGLSSGLLRHFPHMRVVQSSFERRLGEAPVANASDFFGLQLFPREGTDTAWMAQAEAVRDSTGMAPPIFKFAPPPLSRDPSVVRLVDNDDDENVCVPPQQQLLEEGEEQQILLDPRRRQHYMSDTVLIGGDLARYEALNASSPFLCCRACRAQPLCVAWSFGPSGQSGGGEGGGEEEEEEASVVCRLKGSAPVRTMGFAGYTSGSFLLPSSSSSSSSTSSSSSSSRHVAPRAIIFHGTTCIFNNQTVHSMPRDVNTILVGRYMVERAAFTNGLTADEYAVVSCAARMDEIWVPTQWLADVFKKLMENVGLQGGRIAVVPESVDVETFDPSRVRSKKEGNPFRIRSTEPTQLCDLQTPQAQVDVTAGGEQEEGRFDGEGKVTCANKGQRFEFLSIFKWEYRKGWDVLLDAYWSAFTKEDAVVLRLRTYMPSSTRKHPNITIHIEQYAQDVHGKSLSELAAVIWEQGTDMDKLSDALTRADVRDLLHSADAFVLPTRGEGWGLPIAEAMAMQLPVLVTNYSGPNAFTSDESAYLIPVLDRLDDLSFAMPDVRALQGLLRRVIVESGPRGQGKALRKGHEARRIISKFSPDYVASIMAKRLRAEASFRGWDFP